MSALGGRRPRSPITGLALGRRSRDSHRIHQALALSQTCPLGTQPDERVIFVTSSFPCHACGSGVCDLPRPAMVVSGGELRPATEREIDELQVRDVVSWEPVRLPGKGKEGLAQFLSDGSGPGGMRAEGFLITCTCGHLFIDELSRP